MADKDDSLQEFLEFADLQHFQEGLYREGIKKLDHVTWEIGKYIFS
jgi:hypothetical protein